MKIEEDKERWKKIGEKINFLVNILSYSK